MTNRKKNTILILLTLLFTYFSGHSQSFLDKKVEEKIINEIHAGMKDGDIPGLSLVIIEGENQYIKTFGFADIENQVPVTSKTRFEIGSNSKAFTALALLNLVDQQKVDLNEKVSTYLPGFKMRFKGESTDILVKDLLYHTSGIPWESLAKIPEGNEKDVLEKLVKELQEIKLNREPGTAYEYATVNYDIIALIIQEVSTQSFEDYLRENVLVPLNLKNTSIGQSEGENMSKGYKISFFEPRLYESPIFKSNNAAGYVVSNAEDIAQWMKYQINPNDESLGNLIDSSHERDKRVPLHGMTAYAGGWNIALDGSNNIFHAGLNPNFSSHIAINKEAKTGVAILTNSNSNYTNFLTEKIVNIIDDEEINYGNEPTGDLDYSFSFLAIFLALYCGLLLFYLRRILVRIKKNHREMVKVDASIIKKIGIAWAVILPYLIGVYLFPKALAGFDWNSIFVWAPESFGPLIVVILTALFLSIVVYSLNLIYPEKNKFKRVIPMVSVMSVLTGFASIGVIVMITSTLNSDVNFYYLLFYYLLIVGVYIFGRQFIEVNLIRLTNDTVYDLRLKIVDQIFRTTYSDFEKISSGRVYTTVIDDTDVIGNSANTFMNFATGIVTIIGGFIFLGSIAPWATLVTLSTILLLSGLSYLLIDKTKDYFEDARNETNTLTRLIGGVIEGYKEISLSRNKKLEYKEDVSQSASRFREKLNKSSIIAFNISLLSEFLLVGVLGFAAFGMSKFFPDIKTYTVIRFVMILLYLIGPINNLLRIIPQIIRISVSWNRIKDFIADIPIKIDLDNAPTTKVNPVLNMSLNDVTFRYKTENTQNSFAIGPINMNVNAGEILFIAGGNGSGKTTLAKLLTGLYFPDDGSIRINGKKAENGQLSEYISAVFNPTYLFDKLYNIDIEGNRQKFDHYIELLNLHDKVSLKNGRYSTIDLSSGQRKRLALLNCFMEDSPIYIFDEWAADQDPHYRRFFYTVLLPEIKNQGKIIIVITHDDHYFHVADTLMKMDRGVLKEYEFEFNTKLI
nr:hypothetical protein BACY1_00420 [Tenacibaculum mesophilum]